MILNEDTPTIWLLEGKMSQYGTKMMLHSVLFEHACVLLLEYLLDPQHFDQSQNLTYKWKFNG